MIELKAAPAEETPFSRLDRAFRTVLTVSKDKLLKEEAKEQRAKDRKKRKKNSA